MVKEKVLDLIWSPTAKRGLRQAYDYISEDSIREAKKVRNAIVLDIESLKKHSAIFELDRFKYNNPGNYRAFERYHYRVAYKHTETEVHILRVRHTSREPLDY